MKHMLQILLFSWMALLLSACGISKTEYDSLLDENGHLESEIASLSNQVESLSAENDSLSAQVESLSEYKTNQVLKAMDDSYAKAWATTAFGDNSRCFADADNLYLQCISERTYVISTEGISELWSDLLESVALLETTRITYPDKITYETISIKFLDPTGAYILDVILKRTDSSYSLGFMACNVLYADTIASALILTNK